MGGLKKSVVRLAIILVATFVLVAGANYFLLGG